MKEVSRRRFIVASSIAALLLTWTVVAAWLVPWVIAKAYAGEAGAFLNGQITGQGRIPLETYIGIWRGLALPLTAALIAGIALFLAIRFFRRPVAAALRRSVPGLPDGGAGDVFLLALWTGIMSGVAEGIVWMVRNVIVDLPLGDVPWLRLIWLAPIAAVTAFTGLALILLALDRILAMEGALCGGAGAAFVGFGTYGFVRSMNIGIAPWAAGLLALGSGVAFGRLLAARPRGMRRFLRWSLPAVVATVAIMAVAGPARQRALERSALADLPTAEPGLPSVLVVVWDAVRAPNLSLYGYERETTPELKTFAERGVVFDRAISTTSWSLPAHASLFTGRYPFEMSASWTETLDDRQPTLAEVLSDAGFATGAFVANRYYGRRGFGLERGFATYDDVPPSSIEGIPDTWWWSRKIIELVRMKLGDHRRVARRPASDVNRGFLGWQARQAGRPFFAFLNYIDAHEPYRPPDPFNLAFAERQPRYWFDWGGGPQEPDHLRELQTAYDGSIRYLDYEFDNLLKELDRRGVLDSMIVVVTSDHGEEFGEHGTRIFGHGVSLYMQALHVPLVIVAPGGIGAGSRSQQAVSLRDVPATVLDLLGLKGALPGVSLVPALTGSDTVPGEPRLAQLHTQESWKDRPDLPASAGDAFSLLWNELHYIRNGDGSEHLFDLARDPVEAQDLARSPAAAERLAWFRDQLERITNGRVRPTDPR